MKVAIPADDKSMNKGICKSFGRAPYFLVYDTETDESAFFENQAATSRGGAGIKAGQAVVDTGVQALLTPRCGENAANVLQTANVKIYKTINDSLKDNIEAFKAGKLELLNEIHAGFHNKGGE